MTTRAQIDAALNTVAKNQSLDASNPELCSAALYASFDRFAEHVGVNTPSSASGLNTISIIRRRCAMSGNEGVEANWIAARLVGVAHSEKIVVDSLLGASMVVAAGGQALKTSPEASGYLYSLKNLPPEIEIAPKSRLAVIRGVNDNAPDDRILNAGRLATVTLEKSWCIDLYQEDVINLPQEISIEEINKASGAAIDVIPPRHTDVRRAKAAGPAKAVPISYDIPQRDQLSAVNDIYDTYTPEVAVVATGTKHPAPLIQSKTLAGSKPLPPTYKPVFDPEVIANGALSDVQFETVVLAGEAHAKRLPFDTTINASPRIGFLVADGTGAGKTNSTTGIILDNFNQGRRRAIVIAEKDRHRDGVAKAMNMLGMPASSIINLRDYKAKHPLPKRDGVLFLTYALLRSLNKNGSYDRVQQIVDWVGKDFEGVLVFDESQNMRNGLGAKTTDGPADQSLQARAGIELQNRLPDARVVYSSATGSTLLENLAYMVRLGLWGIGTPYADTHAFVDSFATAGLSGLEAITAHIKSAGQMVCRQLSMDGIVYDELIHVMAPKDVDLFDAYSRMLYEITGVAETCASHVVPHTARKKNTTWRNLKSNNGLGQNYASSYAQVSKRMIDTLIVSIKTETMVADMRNALARGEACVIQLQNTFEAELDRAIDSGQAYDTDQFQATSELVRFVESLPEVELDSELKPLLKNGKPVTVQTCVDAKAAIIKRIKTLPGFIRPLEQLFNAFGTSRIAEVTGRSKRAVPLNTLGNQGDPNAPINLELRSDHDRRRDWRAFMNDQKQVLVFSNDAGGTGMDYHASLFHRNQRLRRHYVLQLGHRADQVIQGQGRSHRSAQKQPPVIVYVALDLPAEKVYISNVVARMASLGALSQGHRGASSNGLFTTLDTYNSAHAIAGWGMFVHKLKAGEYADLTIQDLSLVGQLERTGGTGALIPLQTFLKRAATLPIAVQKRAFAYLDHEINNHIMALISDGNYDSGPEMMRDTVKVLNQETIYTHPYTQARILVTHIECDIASSLSSFSDAYQTAVMMRPGTDMPRVFFNKALADVWIEYDAGALATGFRMVNILRPDSETTAPLIAMRGRQIEQINDQSQAEALWNIQIERIKKYRQKDRIMISGALPLVWNYLRRGSSYNNRLWLARTDTNERILGFVATQDEVDTLRLRLGALTIAPQMDMNRLIAEFKADKTIVLANNMIITPQLVMTAVRQTLNVSDAKLPEFRDKANDLGLQAVNFSGLEYFVFPLTDADRNKALKNLISLYGYKETTDQPDWSLLA